jgi:glutamate-5-semialdehyde dehydrogenase
MSSAAVAISTREKLERAQRASRLLAQLSTAQKNDLLFAIAAAIEGRSAEILRANEEDIRSSNLSGALRDRLLLTPERIAAMASAVREVAALPDPINEVLEEWIRPNGLIFRKVRVPLGVIGIVYEARPNVTVDAAVLCLKTANAVVLRGGKEAQHSNQILVEIMASVSGVPPGAIELLDSSSRDSVQELIRARGLVDVVIPRGGPGLITHVMENSLVPVIETGAGNCHIFVDESADFEMATRIVLNAKTQRPSVCNAAEKLLVHARIASAFIPQIARQLAEAGVAERGHGRRPAQVRRRPSCRTSQGRTVDLRRA